MKKNLLGLFLVIVLIISVTPSSESAVVSKGVSSKLNPPLIKLNDTKVIVSDTNTSSNQTNYTIIQNKTIIIEKNETLNKTEEIVVNSSIVNSTDITNFTIINGTNSTLPIVNITPNNETNSTLPEINVSVNDSTEIKGNLSTLENETEEKSDDNSRPPVIKSPDEYENYYGKTAYYYVGNQKIASAKNAEVNYYVSDHLGSSSLVLNDKGDVVSEDSYYAYGQEKESIGNEKYKYTGKELDEETGIYYYGARYYEPLIGRFLEVDPMKGSIESPQSLNRYTYTLNNPMRLVDPDGRETKPADQEIGTALSKRQEYWKAQGREYTQKARETLKVLYDSPVSDSLKDIKVEMVGIDQTSGANSNSNLRTLAQYEEKTKTIEVDTTYAKKASKKDIMSVIGGHELGHAVQSLTDKQEIKGDWNNLVKEGTKYNGNKQANSKASSLMWDIVNRWGNYYASATQGQKALTDPLPSYFYGMELRSTTNEKIVEGDSIPDWRKGMGDIDSTRATKETADKIKNIWK